MVGQGKFSCTLAQGRRSSVIQTLLQSQHYIAYFSCPASVDQDKALEDPHKNFQSLLRQLVSLDGDPIDEIRSAFARKDREDLIRKDIKDLLLKLIGKLRSVAMVVDGLNAQWTFSLQW
ncbi:hypothetical protein GX50_01481 [[Emmonsia] crescens]|uniref:Nephrocystin 3-like N-terminal domain-containing protein n=1 Tax=[Emmonsia] crescens TaxID=73230 RepID=A0A2B7ZR08_9EURO|nr:hypothetical protein GX50_01481 [Emmonsia crescens]